MRANISSNIVSRIGGIPLNKKDLKVLVGNNIRKERVARNISTEELAGLIGHTPSSVGLIERGDRGASAYILHKLSKIFNVPTDNFFLTDEKEAKKRHPSDRLKSLVSDLTEDEIGFMIHVVKGLRELKM
jgi:transcriptional regulator with XRE-family HTH domain